MRARGANGSPIHGEALQLLINCDAYFSTFCSNLFPLSFAPFLHRPELARPAHLDSTAKKPLPLGVTNGSWDTEDSLDRLVEKG